ncbi:hypothetical protein OUZ56_012354 [Daphnia magna]|uniref:HAT C-terminal dimerisation domain-containing protein n=1 Tax=Daphnia magna TaxID=35525 RepID=A0ABQ9Z2Y0_9CRUS|nr:hypothetical protein OUZ56_012354 [Daphnia magna]
MFYRKYATETSDTERQPPQDQEEDIVGPTQPKRKSRSLYSMVIEPRRLSSVDSSKAFEELKIYLNYPTLPMEEIRSLEFWRLNSHRFPVLSPIARDIFGIPASSGSVERVYSTATDILSAKQNRKRILDLEILCLPVDKIIAPKHCVSYTLGRIRTLGRYKKSAFCTTLQQMEEEEPNPRRLNFLRKNGPYAYQLTREFYFTQETIPRFFESPGSNVALIECSDFTLREWIAITQCEKCRIVATEKAELSNYSVFRRTGKEESCGKPSGQFNHKHVDWAPSINLGLKKPKLHLVGDQVVEGNLNSAEHPPIALMDVTLPEEIVESDCSSPITLITVSSSAESPMETHD